MSVSTIHNLYAHYAHQVKLCRDALAGTPAIIKNADIYIPPLSDLSEEANAKRIRRASFDNYTSRALDGFTGLIFSKNPTHELPQKVEDLLTDIDMNKKTDIDLVQEATDEVLTTDLVGLLVDMETVDNVEPTLRILQEDKRPYITIYTAENIINWRYENNRLVMVVLKDSKQVWTTQFESEYIDTYRVLYIDEDGYYAIDLYEDETKITDAPIKPTQNNARMSHIPFYPITSNKISLYRSKPPIYDLADSNISMHKLKVDLYHSLFFTIPTPYGRGMQSKEANNIVLGSTSFQCYSSPQAELKYLEFEGQGLQHYENAIEKCEESMASLGAEFLRNNSSKVEAAETVAIRNSADRATLISVADTIGRGFLLALKECARWMNISDSEIDKMSYSLNKDYNLTKMTAQEITALTSSWLGGAITRRDLFLSLKKGEILNDDIVYDDWVESFELETNRIEDGAI